MRSTFFGLDMALRALQTQQQAIDITNHNVANANTEGFSRQTAQLGTTEPYTVPAFNRNPGPGQVGTGVQVELVKRVRDLYLDAQIRQEQQALGRWEATSNALQQIEVIFNEPSDSGLNTLMGRFWAAWQDLTSNPEDVAVRSNLVEQANNLAVMLRRDYDQLVALRHDMDQQIRIKAADVNGIAQQLADLNAQIAAVQLTGDQANDLKDKRDLLLDRLSKISKISYNEAGNGAVNVFLEGMPLVEGNRANTLRVAEGADGFARITWSSNGLAVAFGGGEIQGLLEVRDAGIPQRLEQLQQLASTLITQVNGIHRGGFGLDGSTSEIIAGLKLVTAGGTSTNVAISAIDVSGATEKTVYTFSSAGASQLTLSATINGVARTQTVSVSDMLGAGSTQVLDFSDLGVKLTLVGGGTDASAANIVDSLTKPATDELTTGFDFFTGTGANDIAVHPAVLANPNVVAAASVPCAPGDGSNALAIAQLQHRSDEASVTGIYKAMIAQLGVDGEGAQTMVTNEDLLVQHLERRKETVSGISLDEETANLIRYQHAYQAAARVMTAIDEMLNTIINGMGIVGR